MSVLSINLVLLTVASTWLKAFVRKAVSAWQSSSLYWHHFFSSFNSQWRLSALCTSRFTSVKTRHCFAFPSVSTNTEASRWTEKAETFVSSVKGRQWWHTSEAYQESSVWTKKVSGNITCSWREELQATEQLHKAGTQCEGRCNYMWYLQHLITKTVWSYKNGVVRTWSMHRRDQKYSQFPWLDLQTIDLHFQQPEKAIKFNPESFFQCV